MTLKLIRDFRAPTDEQSSAELRRQLVQFELNVSDLGARLEVASAKPLAVIETEGRDDTLSVGPGESLGIVRTVTRVQLRTPTVADAGKFLCICKGAGAASNTTVVPPPGALINGAATYTIATSGDLLLVYCDGTNYWAKT